MREDGRLEAAEARNELIGGGTGGHNLAGSLQGLLLLLWPGAKNQTGQAQVDDVGQ